MNRIPKVGDYVEVTKAHGGKVTVGRQGIVTSLIGSEKYGYPVVELMFPDLLNYLGEWDEAYADGWKARLASVKVIHRWR
ncbi:hypothetical protein LCGC14_2699060 [marine sediment metagenome]|uniref:Uncharacterized protein n=1 Tax=marine sediment metagenome TaxID=412755 RepID=A0A0F9A3U3_9ZZZZ